MGSPKTIMQELLSRFVSKTRSTVQIPSSVSGSPFIFPTILPHLTPSSLLEILSFDFLKLLRIPIPDTHSRSRQYLNPSNMLGKRARRPPIKRTTSMTEFNMDLTAAASNQPYNGGSAASTPRTHRRNSGDFVETSHFLRVCFLCQRRLVHGQDIYMYRGDSAFCSLECRQQQMVQDERTEKCSVASKKDAGTAASAAAGPQVPAKGERVAAV